MKLLLIFNPQIKLIIFFLAQFMIAPLSHSQFNFADWSCRDVGNYTTHSTYRNNLFSHFTSLTIQASVSRFGYSFAGEGFDKVHILYNCRGDLDSHQCRDCVKQAREEIIERCPSSKESIVWLEECLLRVANRPLLSLEEESPYSWGYSGMFSDYPTPHLIHIVAENIDHSIEQAAYNKTTKGFATGRANIGLLEDVYFLVQCTPDILGNRCERCLRAAFKSMDEYGNLAKSTAMMMFYPSCHIRYDREPMLLNGAMYSSNLQPLPNLASPPSYFLSPPPTSAGEANVRIELVHKIIIGIGHIVGMLILYDEIRKLVFFALGYLAGSMNSGLNALVCWTMDFVMNRGCTDD